MDQTDSRKLPRAVRNERRRRVVKLRERGRTLREVATQTEGELSVPTVMLAYRASQADGWAAVQVKPRGRSIGDGSTPSGSLDLPADRRQDPGAAQVGAAST